MVSKESTVHLRMAEDQLEDAKHMRKRSYALCTLLSAMSAENAASALIIARGGKPSRSHRNSVVLYKLAAEAEIIGALKELEPHTTKAKYPIFRGQELLPPSVYYTREMAEDALGKAEIVLKQVRGLI